MARDYDQTLTKENVQYIVKRLEELLPTANHKQLEKVFKAIVDDYTPYTRISVALIVAKYKSMCILPPKENDNAGK